MTQVRRKNSTHVELSTALGVRGVESEQLNPHQVLARSNARWHIEVLPTTALNHPVDTPLTIAVRQAILSYLEPTKSAGGSRGRVVDLGEIDRDGALMGGGDRVVRVVGHLCSPDNMAPPCTDASTGGDADDGRIRVLQVVVAGHTAVVDILDGLL